MIKTHNGRKTSTTKEPNENRNTVRSMWQQYPNEKEQTTRHSKLHSKRQLVQYQLFNKRLQGARSQANFIGLHKLFVRMNSDTLGN